MNDRWVALAVAMLACACGGKVDDGPPVLPEPDIEFQVDAFVQAMCMWKPLPDPNVCVVIQLVDDAEECGAGRVELDAGVCLYCLHGDGVARTRDVLDNDVSDCRGYDVSGDFVEYLEPLDSPDECPTTGVLKFRGDTIPQLGSVIQVACQ